MRKQVRFIPIEEGDEVDLEDIGIFGVSGQHQILGYQPAPLNPRARKPYVPHGWIVVLVNVSVTPHPRKLRRTRA